MLQKLLTRPQPVALRQLSDDLDLAVPDVLRAAELGGHDGWDAVSLQMAATSCIVRAGPPDSYYQTIISIRLTLDTNPG